MNFEKLKEEEKNKSEQPVSFHVRSRSGQNIDFQMRRHTTPRDFVFFENIWNIFFFFCDSTKTIAIGVIESDSFTLPCFDDDLNPWIFDTLHFGDIEYTRPNNLEIDVWIWLFWIINTAQSRFMARMDDYLSWF